MNTFFNILIGLIVLGLIGFVSWMVVSDIRTNGSLQYSQTDSYNKKEAPLNNVVVSPWPPQPVKTSQSSMAQETPQVVPIAQTVTATIKTNKGDIVVNLIGEKAPLTVGNFVYLAQNNFYDGTTFHRVIPNFMIQGGDPLSKDPAQRQYHGTGGPGYKFQDEINDRPIVRGTIAMANAGANTNGSQFFIVTRQAVPELDGKHTNFGEVIQGMDIVDAISNVQRDSKDNPIDPVVIQDVILQAPQGN